MFASEPEFDFPLQGLGLPGVRFHRRIEVSVRMSWYVATFSFRDSGVSLLYTFCCSSGGDLLSLLKQAAAYKLTALHQIRPGRGEDHGWSLRDIHRVWEATEPTSMARVAFLEDKNGREFWDDDDEETVPGKPLDKSLIATTQHEPGLRSSRSSKQH